MRSVRHVLHKSGVTITHEQNIICRTTHLDGIRIGQTNFCKSPDGLAANEKEEKMYQMIILVIIYIWVCLTRTGNLQIHEFNFTQSIGYNGY